METKVRIVRQDIEQGTECKALDEAGEILRAGGLVAFPTETVYGLGGDALSPEASGKIYQAKGRPSDNPLIVHIAKESDLSRLTDEIPEKAKVLMDLFWPGPLTLIFRKRPEVPDQTTGGLDTVAVRMPSHHVAYELIRRSGVLIAAPSANLSGRPSPTRAAHVIEDMQGRIDLILDGGSCKYGIESTIVDMTEDIPMILRPGYITRGMLEEAVGPVKVDPAIDAVPKEGAQGMQRPKAPGMRYTHYAPKGILSIVSGKDPEAVIAKINALCAEKKKEGYKVGVLATGQYAKFYEADEVLVLGDTGEDPLVSANLYHMLRVFDSRKVEYIYSQSFADCGLGDAIMNRLIRAAGHRMLEA